MKKCPFCGYSNYDYARACRKCDNSFLGEPGTVYQGRPHWIGSRRAKIIRSHALSMVVLGLLIKVYWGGYGPWPTIDSPTLVTVRTIAEPLLLYFGGVLYILGWVATLI